MVGLETFIECTNGDRVKRGHTLLTVGLRSNVNTHRSRISRQVPRSTLGWNLSCDKVTSRVTVWVGVSESDHVKPVWSSGLHV